MTTGYDVTIRRNADGQERIIHMDHGWAGHSHWWWTEGNFSCDCNRHIVFCEAASVSALDCPCGTTAYTAVAAILPDGRRIALDGAHG